MRLEVSGLHKSYGRHIAVCDVDLTVAEGEFVVILGPSGCGKTTTLRCLAGLERPNCGTIRIGATTVFGEDGGIFVPPEQRNIGMIFQSYALWPHMTVYENVAFPFEARRQRGAGVRARVREVLALVGLAGLEDRSASLLSGGQMQRVALARALACKPAALLFDEPLSNLDQKLRQHLRQELRDLQKKSGASAVFVTHDQNEAAALADRIIVMNEGRVVQNATPECLFSTPADRFTADFIGIPNILQVSSVEQVGRDRWHAGVSAGIQLNATAFPAAKPSVGWWVWFRAEHVSITTHPSSDPKAQCFAARIAQRTFAGLDYTYRLRLNGLISGQAIDVVARSAEKYDVGRDAFATISGDNVHLVPGVQA